MEGTPQSSPKRQPFKPNFEQEQAFQDLSAFFANSNENNLEEIFSNPKKTVELQTLLNEFFKSVSHSFIENKINPKVFELVSHCLNFISQAPQTNEIYSDAQNSQNSGHFNDDNRSAESDSRGEYRKLHDENHRLIEITEQELVGRIAKQVLNVDLPINEAELVERLNEKLKKYKDVKAEIIDTFDLPQNTKTNAIVPVLRTKLDFNTNESFSQKDNQTESKSDVQQRKNSKGNSPQNKPASHNQSNEYPSKSPSKPTLKQQLIEITNELTTARGQLQKALAEGEKKDKQIQELKENMQNLKNKSKNSTMIHDMHNEIMNNKVQFGKLISENNVLKRENENVHQRCEALELKLNTYKKQIIKDKEINTRLIEKLAQTKKQLQVQQKQDEETTQEAIKLQEQHQTQQYVNIFDQLTKQYESQAEELSNETEFRSHLVEAIQKLCQLNQALEHHLEEAQLKLDGKTKQKEITGKQSESVSRESSVVADNKNNRNKNLDDSENQTDQEQDHSEYSISENAENNNNNNKSPRKPNNKSKQTKSSKKPTTSKSTTKQNANKAKKQNDNNNNDDDKGGDFNDSSSRSSNINRRVEYVDEYLIDTIQDVIGSLNEEKAKESLNEILQDNEQTIAERVTFAVNALVNTINDNSTKADEVETSNKLVNILLNTSGSIISFLNSIIETGEITKWTMNDHSFDEARALLSTQIARITRFINENCKGVVEDKAFLSTFLKFSDPTELDAALQKVMEQYKDPQTAEGKELMALLLQSVSAGTVLHSFALQAKNQCSKQAQDIKSMKQQEKQYQQHEKEHAKESKSMKSAVDKYTKALESVRSALKQAVVDNKYDPNLILDNLDNLNEVANIEDKDYIKSLHDKLKENMEKHEENEVKLNELNSKYNDAIAQSNEQLNVNKQNTDQINSLEQKLKQLSEDNLNLSQENDQLKQKVDNVSNELVHSREAIIALEEEEVVEKFNEKEVQRRIKEEVEPLEQTIDQLRNENELLYQKVQTINEKAVDKLNKLKASLKRSKERMQDDFEQKKLEYRAIIQQNRAQIESLENEVEDAKASESETKEVVDMLHKDMDEIKESFNSLQAEYKLTKSRLVGKEEQIKREKAAFDAQFRLKQFAAQTEAQAQIDSFRYENNAKTNDFLVAVCRLFNEFVDPDKPINYESVLEMLNEVSEVTKTNAAEAEKAAEAVQELDTVRKQLGLKKNGKITPLVREVQKQNTQLNEQVTTLQQETQEAKKQTEEMAAKASGNIDWQNWARSLFEQIADGYDNVSDDKGVQSALEEAVLTAAGNPRVTRQRNFLRTEKKLIQKGVSKMKVKNPKLSISQVMVIVIAIKRLQKMSGHKTSTIAVSCDPDEDEQNARRSGKSRSLVKPLFKQFVRQSVNQQEGEQKK